MNGKETNHYKHFLSSKKTPDETALLFLEGWIGEMMGQGKDLQHNGCLILTNKRVAFCRKGMMGEVFQYIPVEKITSVETRSTMGYRVLVVHTSHDELRFKTFEPSALFTQTYNRIEELQKPFNQAAIGVPLQNDAVELIQRLGTLRDNGLISTDEFETKKAEILARL
jgi:hypothetical protein